MVQKRKYQIINYHCSIFLLYVSLYLDSEGRVRSKKFIKYNLDLDILTTL